MSLSKFRKSRLIDKINTTSAVVKPESVVAKIKKAVKRVAKKTE